MIKETWGKAKYRWKVILLAAALVLTIWQVAVRTDWIQGVLSGLTGRDLTVEEYRRKAIESFGKQAPDEAVIYLKKAIGKEPNRADLRYFLALALESIGRTQEAITEYEKVITLNKNLAAPHFNLAVIYQRQGDNGKAEEHFKEAIRIEPQFTVAHYLLGSMYINQQRFNEALPELEAVARGPRVADVDVVKLYLVLGDVYDKLGKGQEALSSWQEVLKVDPDNQEAKKRIESR